MHGFLYKSPEERAKEFALAEYFFKKYPTQIKISRLDWENFITELEKNENAFYDDHETLKQLGIDLDYLPQHSYFKPKNGPVLAFSRGKLGGELGSGTFGSVKFVVDKNNRLYAMKTEETNDTTSHEASIAFDLQLMIEKKLKRSEKNYDYNHKIKYYSLFIYLGKQLKITLLENSFLFEEKVTLARKLSWEVYKLNTGLLSSSRRGYVLHDIKPTNIVIDDHAHPKLVDYGFASIANTTNLATGTKGTPKYLPLTEKEMALWLEPRSKGQIDYILNERLKTMTPVEKDLFALKRTLYLGLPSQTISLSIFMPQEYKQLPEALQDILNTQNISTAIRRKQYSALMLTLHFIAVEYKQDIKKILNYSTACQLALCECLEKIDDASRDVSQSDKFILNTLRAAIFVEQERSIITLNHELPAMDIQTKTDASIQPAQIESSISLISKAPYWTRYMALESEIELIFSKNDDFSLFQYHRLGHKVQSAYQLKEINERVLKLEEIKAALDNPYTALISIIFNQLTLQTSSLLPDKREWSEQQLQLLGRFIEYGGTQAHNIESSSSLLGVLSEQKLIDSIEPSSRKKIRTLIHQHNIQNMSNWDKPSGTYEHLIRAIVPTPKPIGSFVRMMQCMKGASTKVSPEQALTTQPCRPPFNLFIKKQPSLRRLYPISEESSADGPQTTGAFTNA